MAKSNKKENLSADTGVPTDYDNSQFTFPDYSEEELSYRADLIKKLTYARAAFNSFHRELNDMTFQEYYDSNLRAANAYIPPKKNLEDTRIVTGITEEKGATLLSAILNYNLEPNILGFDSDDMEVDELGLNMGDLIKKSRQLEDYDTRRPLIYKELFDQGTCYVEELWVEETTTEKKLKNLNWGDGISINGTKWTSKEVPGFVGCKTRLMRGDKVLLGNVHEFEIANQPFVAVIDTIPWAMFQAVYGNWERAKFVPRRIVRTVAQEQSTYRMWTLEVQQTDFVEILKYFDPWKNEMMIIANGVLMLPVGFPLTAVSPSGAYPIAKGDAYPISQFFAISKSIPAKTKVDQEVLDEFLRLIVLKTRQSFKPPVANNTGRVLNRKMFEAGQITNQIDPTKILPIGPTTGVSQSEFEAFQFIKTIVDAKSVSPAFAGDSESGRHTATEVLELKKQQMMKLGLAIYGVVNLEVQLSKLRLYNILTNWTKVQDQEISEITGKMEDVYKSVMVDSTMPNSQPGKKIIQFSPDTNNLSSEQISEEENQLSQSMRVPVQKVYIHPDVSKVKFNWYVTINPTEKDSSDLHRVMFKQDIQDAITLFGPASLNYPYLQQRYAVGAKEDPDKFFIKQVPAQPTEAAMGGGDNGGLGAQLNRGLGMAAAPAAAPIASQLAPQ